MIVTLNERLTAAIRHAAAEQARAARIVAAKAGNIVACAWCGHHRAAEQWGELPWRLTPAQRRLLSHGICDDCFERELVRVREVGQPPGKTG